jgi:phosphohistidine phosphatase
MGAGVGRPILDQAAAEARLQAPGERDHALGVAIEELEINAGLAAREPVEEPCRAELDQVAKPGVVGREQGEVVALHPTAGERTNIVDEVRLEPEDRLDPGGVAGLVVLDGAVHHPVVGQTQGGHAELRGASSHRPDLACAVEQRVLAVDVEVDGCSAHIHTARASPARLLALEAPRSRSMIATRDDGIGTQPRYLGRSERVIWLLRHGDAQEHPHNPAEGDAGRSLTAKGERQATAAGAALKVLGIELDACLTSPKARAAATAKLVCEPLGVEAEETQELRGGDFEPADLAAGHGDEVLLVGHEPDLSRAIQAATGARVALKKGGLAAIDGPTLACLLRPDQIEAIATGARRA